ncbi:MAG: hypothetical protein SGARI_004081 [Bacillariaceae sp.]
MDDLFEMSESSLSADSPKKEASVEAGSKQGSKDGQSLGTCSLGNDFLEFAETLRESKALPTEAARALKGLSNKKLSAEDYDHLSDVHAFSAIVEAMVIHDGNFQVQRWGCQAIWVASGTTQNQVAFVNANGLDAILCAIERFPGKVDLLESALAAVSNLVAAEENLRTSVEKGVIDKVMTVMTSNLENTSIQSQGCVVISNIAMHKSSNKEEIFQRGAGMTVMSAMVEKPSDHVLIQKALSALRNLCIQCDSNKADVANLGLIEVVLNAMKTHREQPKVQEEGARLIAGMGKSGAITTVIQCLDNQSDSPTIQKVGFSLLTNIARASDEAKLQIVDEGGLDAVSMAMMMAMQSENDWVLASACILLNSLAIEGNDTALMASGVVEQARLAMNKFPDTCGNAAGELLRFYGSSQ